ncbi:AraC family transcriptional regulator [Xaviernesmea oryzae]|uniref:AraC family transcriptional regulator n=1 Tax=Xaviernesmea oryzae TaxID=464029 RepID=A0A1Q9ATW1_9HYPH|nr:GlxA family transcriptional regulator [Xaviernesmea oryzae]OLP58869.1 AraC family transcriptional regulator [Xaviernesmea oryzae]SEM03375.1 Transcriptional regulator GlxA family, contains an amidase domain and an AraC-type DNA-binding HTH domain [Xaviernesmea oryzae]
MHHPHRVEILAFGNAQLLDITGPAQVFASANDMSDSRTEKPYEIEIVSREAEVVTSSGVVLRSTALPEGSEGPGTLIVSGGRGVNEACKDRALLDWLRRRVSLSSRTASVCSGAFLLAEAGLLDGRRATTHWQRCAEFRQRYPAVRLEDDPIFVRDGTIWTSAGITSGIDLALAMVEADRGKALALAVARQLVVFLKRPGGQAQFSAMLDLTTGDDRFERLHAWIATHLAEDLSLETLSHEAGMSLRTFSRRYRQSTGRTPAEGVEMIRSEAGRRLLEEGMPVTRVAARCGFGSTETMRRIFLKHLGVGPAAYRDRFCR